MNQKILNLGAGKRAIKGADNHDIIKHSDYINLVWDLNEVDWFKTKGVFEGDYFVKSHKSALTDRPYNYYDVIEFISVIEHLKITPIESLDQCWKLIKPNGYLVVKYPYYKSETSFIDPTHRWHLTERSLDYVDPNTQLGKDYDYYTPYKWKIENSGIIKERNVKVILRPIK